MLTIPSNMKRVGQGFIIVIANRRHRALGLK